MDKFRSSSGIFHLTLKAPPLFCSRRQFKILALFQKYWIRHDISWESSYLFFWKLGKMFQNLSSAAVVIGALRVKKFIRQWLNEACTAMVYLFLDQFIWPTYYNIIWPLLRVTSKHEQGCITLLWEKLLWIKVNNKVTYMQLKWTLSLLQRLFAICW